MIYSLRYFLRNQKLEMYFRYVQVVCIVYVTDPVSCMIVWVGFGDGMGNLYRFQYDCVIVDLDDKKITALYQIDCNGTPSVLWFKIKSSICRHSIDWINTVLIDCAGQFTSNSSETLMLAVS